MTHPGNFRDCMNCVILQPSYIPWRGYFHQIYKADIFVFYDDVQYDHHGWRNRNRIKTAAGSRWLTIPIRSRGEDWKQKSILQVETAEQENWRRVHAATLNHNYARAPYYARYRPLIESWYAEPAPSLADFNIKTTLDLARELGIGHPRFLRSSTLACVGNKTARLLSILKNVGATHYISGPSAKDYLDVAALNGAGITLEWMNYSYPAYPQTSEPFDPHVSVLDLIMNVGPSAGELIWGSKGV